MAFNFNLKSVTLLFFAVHCAAFSALLLYEGLRKQTKSSLYLGVLLLLSSLYIFPFLSGYAGWYSVHASRQILFYIPFQNLLLIPPILFLYFRSLLSEERESKSGDILHFIPGVLYIVYTLFMFVYDEFTDTSYKFYGDGRDRDFDMWYQITGFISFCLYAGITLRHYFNYVSSIHDTLSFADEVSFRWARNFLLAFITLLALRFVFFFTNPEWGEFGQKFWFYSFFGIVLYYLSIAGFSHAVRISARLTIQKVISEPLDDKLSFSQILTNSEIALIGQKVITLVESKQLFRNPRFTVNDLAAEVGVAPKKISHAINQYCKMNFNDLINQYRVKEILTRIDRGDLKKWTILALAEEAGFNSKTTFNRVFKKVVNLNPKEYASNSAKSSTKSIFGANLMDEPTSITSKT